MMDNEEASKFQGMAVRSMLKKMITYSLIICGVAYLAGSAWWLLLMVPSWLLAIMRTNAQIGTGAYLTARGNYFRERERQQNESAYDEDVVRVEPAENLEDYISQVEKIIDFWGHKEFVLVAQVGDKKFLEKCASFTGEGFRKRIKPQFISLTTIDAAKKLDDRGREFAFEWFDYMRKNIDDLK